MEEEAGGPSAKQASRAATGNRKVPATLRDACDRMRTSARSDAASLAGAVHDFVTLAKQQEMPVEQVIVAARRCLAGTNGGVEPTQMQQELLLGWLLDSYYGRRT